MRANLVSVHLVHQSVLAQRGAWPRVLSWREGGRPANATERRRTLSPPSWPTSGDQPTVSFVIPVRNDADRLAHCLRSIRGSRYPARLLEVVVADNGSTDASASVARASGATVLNLPVVRLGTLRNSGVAASSGEILVFIDADHEIVPDWVQSAVELLSDPHVAAVGAPCHPPSPATWVQRLYDQLRRHPTGQEVVEWLGTGNMAVRRVAFEAAGGFDTTLETCEDVDLCRKLRGQGLTLLADSRLNNVHYGDPRSLSQVFFGEMWRGRDNVRVSLRPPRAWRTVFSAALPLANCLALLVVAVGLSSNQRPGMWLALLAGLGVCSLVGLRALIMLRKSSLRDLFPALAVAGAYELGRTLAVVARLGHGRRKEATE